MENCENCKNNESSYICVCQEKHLCDDCFLNHIAISKEFNHRPISVSHPLVTLMVEATNEIKSTIKNFTAESIEEQIKNLEEYRDKSIVAINKKIQALKSKLKAQPTKIMKQLYNTPQKSFRQSVSPYQNSEKIKRYSSYDDPLTNRYKIVVIGDSQVGKSALLKTFSTSSDNYSQSSSMRSITRDFMIENSITKIEL